MSPTPANAAAEAAALLTAILTVAAICWFGLGFLIGVLVVLVVRALVWVGA